MLQTRLVVVGAGALFRQVHALDTFSVDEEQPEAYVGRECAPPVVYVEQNAVAEAC